MPSRLQRAQPSASLEHASLREPEEGNYEYQHRVKAKRVHGDIGWVAAAAVAERRAGGAGVR